MFIPEKVAYISTKKYVLQVNAAREFIALPHRGNIVDTLNESDEDDDEFIED